MNRREALSRLGLLTGGALSASTLSGLLAGCSTPPAANYTLQFLSEPQFSRVAAIANAIIPDTDTPGAVKAGVDRFVDNMLANYYPQSEAQWFASSLDAFAAAFNADVLTQDELAQVVQRQDDNAFAEGADSADPTVRFYRRLKGLIVSGYYTSEIGMTEELQLKPFGDARMDIPLSEVGRSWSN